jgi:hypothetical protein
MSAASEEINTAGIYCFAHCCDTEKTQVAVVKKLKFSISKIHIEDDDCLINDECEQEDQKIKNLYETEALDRAIVKIGTLLALGFGEAGSGIIG